LDPIRSVRPAACLFLLWIPLSLHAHSQEAAPGLIVTYVEAPAAKGAALATDLKAYAAQIESAAGKPKVTVLSEFGRPGRMAVIEQWSDLSSAAYAQSEGMLLGKVQADVLAPIDRRLNHPLAPAQSQAGPTAFCVLMHVDVSPNDGTTKILQTQGEAVLAARGALGYEVAVQDKRANHFAVYERWSSRAAYEAYAATGPAVDLRRQLAPLIGSPFDERFYSTVGH
jgi:quinol monooxygenase YgiN